MNNFQRLEEEEINDLPELPLHTINNNIHNRIDNMRTMGSIVDLYLSKIVDVFVMMTGGKVERRNNTFTHSGGHGSPTEPDSGYPSGPSDEY